MCLHLHACVWVHACLYVSMFVGMCMVVVDVSCGGLCAYLHACVYLLHCVSGSPLVLTCRSVCVCGLSCVFICVGLLVRLEHQPSHLPTVTEVRPSPNTLRSHSSHPELTGYEVSVNSLPSPLLSLRVPVSGKPWSNGHGHNSFFPSQAAKDINQASRTPGGQAKVLRVYSHPQPSGEEALESESDLEALEHTLTHVQSHTLETVPHNVPSHQDPTS